MSLLIAGLSVASPALADEPSPHPGWTITDVSECLEAASRGVFLNYKNPTDQLLKFRMGGKDYATVCQAASYRFFYKEREYNLVSIGSSVGPEIAERLSEESVEKLEENCNILAKSNTAICDYKSFKGNSTTYADMDEMVELLSNQ